VTVGDEDAVQAPETGARFKNLPLGAFATVNHESAVAIADDLGGQSAMNRWRRSRRSKKDNVKQGILVMGRIGPSLYLKTGCLNGVQIGYAQPAGWLIHHPGWGWVFRLEVPPGFPLVFRSQVEVVEVQ